MCTDMHIYICTYMHVFIYSIIALADEVVIFSRFTFIPNICAMHFAELYVKQIHATDNIESNSIQSMRVSATRRT